MPRDTKAPGEDGLEALAEAIARFNRERDWSRFHTPRDLAMALSVEAAELLELFLWKGGPEDLPPAERLREEIGDVLICLVNLAERLDIDVLAAAREKLAVNARKYPVASARGNARKWNELEAPHGSDGSDSGPEEASTTR